MPSTLRTGIMNAIMTLNDIGYNESIESLARERNTGGFQAARVISEQKERYVVFSAGGEYDAEVTGNLRFAANGREDFPAVGDWVLITPVESGFAVIHALLPRSSAIRRKAPDREGDAQIIAANIDCALIVQAADRDCNLNRIERYLAICGDSRIQSAIALTKTDLFGEDQIADLSARVRARFAGTPVFALSCETKAGLEALRAFIARGKTWCLLGSSGVGKSTLLNALAGKKLMQTGEISGNTGKGRHTTSHRELVVLDGGGILIDNPGMREVGLTDSETGLARAFAGIAELSRSCRFADCSHTREKGCAVLSALENGSLERGAYQNFLRMEKEQSHFAATAAEKRRKDRDFGKSLKTYHRDKQQDKF